MLAEARRNPEWAHELQWVSLPSWFRERLDEETVLADVIVVGSTFVKNTMVASGVEPTKICVVPLGVERQRVAKVRRMRAMDDPHVRIVFAGQLTQRKGVSYLVEAWNEVRQVAPFVRLRFVGNGSRTMVETLRRAHAEVRSALPHPQLDVELRAADIMVLPSLGDGFPLTVIEAMAQGTPVVVSERTMAGDLIEHGVSGYVVGAADAGALADVLRGLVGDPQLRADVGWNGRDVAAAHTWDRYGERFWRSLCGRG